MHTISTLSFATVSGTSAEATFGTPGDGRLLVKVSVTARGKTVSGWVDGLKEARDPATQPAKSLREFHAALRGRGATHYILLPGDGNVTLALDALTAGLFATISAEAQAETKRIEAERNARQEARIRATGTVRRVLRHSPLWPDAYGLEEAYPTDKANDAAWVRYGIPGAEAIKVHPRCPSLRAIAARSDCWGAFPGHTNSLSLVSDADWDTLVAETAEQDRQDAKREVTCQAEDAAQQAELRTVAVPAEAVAAFQTYGGSAEAAWEDAEEGAASLIRIYGDAIEAQGIAFATVDRSMLPLHPPGA